ncbi:lipid kinase YegS [Arboricoccus pini]|uniref:Lipid kinase YegS n=1 Tax=Arboricoccus pini TaxID=1963835 RepID=A0A212R6Z2_9PROT|nr:lipid kinase YegS [Arboricoccus pini]
MFSIWRARVRAIVRRVLGLKPKLPKSDRRLRLILNGKSADRADIRLAIEEMRQAGTRVDLAITHRLGDATHLASISTRLCDVVVAAGGDGTIQEVVEGILRVRPTRRPSLALLPAGTANDFATGCQIPRFPPLALQLAASGRSRSIDVLQVRGLDPIGEVADLDMSIAVNVITAAFIDENATEISDELKRLIGGPAYWIAGILRTLHLRPRRIEWRSDDARGSDDLVVLTLANGRQTGGGSVVAPSALINDGLMDVRMIRAFEIADFPAVVREVGDPDFPQPRFVIRCRTKRFTLSADEPWNLTLDGEPRTGRRVEVNVLHKPIRLVLPPGAPVRPHRHRP